MLETKAIFIAIVALSLLIIGVCTKNQFRLQFTIGRQKSILLDINYLVILILFWLFAVCVTDSYDLSNYRWAYDDRVSHGKEFGFDLVAFFFHDIGWSFDAFKALWVTVISLLLYRGIKKYGNNPGKVVALALYTAFLGFITQMRSAMVGAIFVNAFDLLCSRRKRDRVLYALIILACAQFHIIAYCFLLFLLIPQDGKFVFKRAYYIVIAIITVIAMFGSSFLSSVFGRILSFSSADSNDANRAASYFQGGASHFRYEFFLLCKHYLLFMLTNRVCDRQLANRVLKLKKTRLLQRIMDANSLMLVFLPVTMLSASFERLFYYFALIQYAVVFAADRKPLKIFKRFSWSMSEQSILVIGTLLITFVEWYFSPDDVIRIVNSVKWIF